MDSHCLYALPPFLSSVVLTFLGIIIYRSNHSSTRNRAMAIGCFATTLWLLSYSINYVLPNSPFLNLFLSKISYLAITIIWITYLHFTIAFLKIEAKKLLIFSYAAGAVLILLALFTDLIIEGNYQYFWGPYPKAGKLHFLCLLYAGYIWIYCIVQLYRGYTKNKSRYSIIDTNRIRYVFWAFLIGNSAALDYVPNYGYEFYPIGFINVAVFTAVIVYAIVRHHLMDIEVIIKKTLVFASLFAILFGVFVGITILTQEIIAGGRLLGLAISSFIIILALRPLEDFLIKVTDKFLFQKKYDYRHLIGQFMDELKTMVLNAGDIAQSTLDFLNSSIRPDNSVIFMHNNFTNKYDIIASVDFHDKNFKLPDNALFIEKLREAGEIVNLKRNKSFSDQELKELEAMGIHLIVPLIIHKELLGILGLGKKKSDEEYAEEDIEALSNLSGTLSIAINNAQLFDERADAEKRAMIGTLATGINHEIGNPLNVIAIKLQSFQLLSQRGLLEKKSKEEIINEVNAITKICLESTKRIADITKKVSEFAKPDKKLALDNVNIVEAINETLAVLEHELVLDRIKLDKNIVCESPYVMADRGQLKQILFNLIKNAAQAIQAARRDGGKIVIGVHKHGEQEISLKISDNGHGIPKKDLDKIFMPFYTTKEPGKGTGLGLALVSRLVERNDAKIEIKSEEGKGTTFTLIFKRKPYG